MWHRAEEHLSRMGTKDSMGLSQGRSVLCRDTTVTLGSSRCLEEGLFEAQTSKELAEARERGNRNQTEAWQLFAVQLE